MYAPRIHNARGLKENPRYLRIPGVFMRVLLTINA